MTRLNWSETHLMTTSIPVASGLTACMATGWGQRRASKTSSDACLRVIEQAISFSVATPLKPGSTYSDQLRPQPASTSPDSQPRQSPLGSGAARGSYPAALPDHGLQRRIQDACGASKDLSGSIHPCSLRKTFCRGICCYRGVSLRQFGIMSTELRSGSESWGLEGLSGDKAGRDA